MVEDDSGADLPAMALASIASTEGRELLCPADARWEFRGLSYRQTDDHRTLVGIHGRDSTGEATCIWTSLPTAVCLLGLLLPSR